MGNYRPTSKLERPSDEIRAVSMYVERRSGNSPVAKGGGRGYEGSYQGNQAYDTERREEGAGGWNSSVSWMRMQAGV
jgi:hypothetical protein